MWVEVLNRICEYTQEAALVPLCLLAAPITALLGATQGYALPLMFAAGFTIAGPDSLLGSAAAQVRALFLCICR